MSAEPKHHKKLQRKFSWALSRVGVWGVWIVRYLLIFAVGVECGENRGRTGGEPGVPKRTGGEPGAFGKRTGGEPGAFGIHLQRVPGEKGGLWDKNRGRTGGRESSLKQETQLGT